MHKFSIVQLTSAKRHECAAKIVFIFLRLTVIYICVKNKIALFAALSCILALVNCQKIK